VGPYRQSRVPTVRPQTRRRALVTLLMLMFVVLLSAEDCVARAASENRTVIRQSVVKSLDRDFTSATEKLDSRDRALGTEGVVSCWKTQYRSKAPCEGRTHLRLDLFECDYSNPSAAQAGLKRFLTTAHPDAGHSYEWEAVFVAGPAVFRLIAGCVISRANFNRMSRDLVAALESNLGGAIAAARCRCGGGCAAVEMKNP
jgi:hypothetical protein